MSTTLIFIHGGPGFSDYLKPYFDGLEPQFKCVFFDQKKGGAIQIGDLLEQLEKIVKAETNKVVIVGHSWGGILATEYVLRHTNEISGLVLMSTGLSASDLKEYRNELARLNLDNPTSEQLFLAAGEHEIGKPFLDETWKHFSEETFESLSLTYLNKTTELKTSVLKAPGIFHFY